MSPSTVTASDINQETNFPMRRCGVLNLDKPIGLTSRDVVDRVVRLPFVPREAGHAGTLDPAGDGGKAFQGGGDAWDTPRD